MWLVVTVLESAAIVFRLKNDFKMNYTLYFYFKDFYFIFRQRGREGGSETSMCGCRSCAPYWGHGLQPRPVPWLEIQLVTLWLVGWRSIHWATPVRSELYTLKWLMVNLCYVKFSSIKKKIKITLNGFLKWIPPFNGQREF